MNHPSKKIAHCPLALILLHSLMMTEEELIENFSTSEIKVKKIRTLALYLHCLQLKGETSLGFSRITKQHYEDFKSQLHRWKLIDHILKNELDHRLNSPAPEASAVTSSNPSPYIFHSKKHQ